MGLSSLSDCAVMIEHFAPFLFDAALKGTLLMGLAGLTAMALRRASAAARHSVWLMGFVSLLVLPVLSAVLPGLNVLPRLTVNRADSLAPNTAANSAAVLPIVDAPTFIRSESPSTVIQTPSVPPTAAPLKSTPIVQPIQDESTVLRSAQRSSAWHFSMPWRFWLVFLWLTGCAVVLLPVLLGSLSLWLLHRRCTRMDMEEWPRLLKQLCQELGIPHRVELLSNPRRTMPMTWGLWHARLLLPSDASNWPAEQRRSVLLHELAHVRRRDCLKQFLVQIGCALYWFNPLVWFASHRMQIERECACDDLVLNHGAKASTYAQELLHIASAIPALRFVGGAVAMARPSTLEERLRMILDPNRNRRALSIKAALAMIFLFSAALVPVAALRAQDNPAPSPTASDIKPTTAPTTALSGNTATHAPFGGSAQARGARGGGDASRFPSTNPTTSQSARGATRGFGGGGIGAGPIAPPILGDGPTCSLDATIYDVRIPTAQIGRLDLNALTRSAATVVDFEKALAELGTTAPLYHANQVVRLAGDRISIGSSTPYITGSTTNARGQVTNVVNYTQTGASFGLAGKTGTGDSIELDLSIQVTSQSDSPTQMSDTVKAILVHNVTLVHKGTIKAQDPFVIVSVDGASTDPTGKAMAFIARVTLGSPQSTSGSARGL